MCNMGAIVYTQTHSDHQVDAGDHVDSEAPEVDKASDINKCEEDTSEHKDAGWDILDEDDSCDKHTKK